MAEDWRKLKDKIGADAQGPTPADWEAMQVKIGAQPALAPRGSKAWLLAGGLGLVIGITVMYLWPSAAGEQGAETTVTIPAEEVVTLEPVVKHNESINASEEISVKEVLSISQSEGLTEDKTVNSSDKRIGKEAVASIVASQSKKTEWNGVANISGGSKSRNKTNPSLEAGSISLADSGAEFKSEPTINVDAPISIEEKGTEEKSAISNVLEEDRVASRESENLDAPETITKETSSIVLQGDSLAFVEEEAAPASQAEVSEKPKPFIPASAGFALNRVNFAAGLTHDFRTPSTFAYGFGFDLQWQKQRQFFSAGLSYYRIEQGLSRSTLLNRSRIDSTWKQEVEPKEVTEIRRIWVIDSFQAGRYVNDTIVRTVVDTSVILQVDTNQYQTNFVKQVVRPYYYAELPLLYGYQFGRGPWQLQVAGGVALQQAIAYSNDEDGSRSLFGMSALMQPALAWRYNDRWSALARVQLRYPLQQDVALYEEPALRYSFQLGVSFRW